nr:MAG TPA: antirepressor [Caudoviricetes sp.]
METRIENWNGYDIRFVSLDGDWYAVLKDICDVLGLRTDKVATRIPPECMERIAVTSDPLSKVDRYERDPVKTITRQMIGRDIGRKPGDNITRSMLVINESGIYEALFASRKLEARKFRQWTAGVLGKLRKTVGLEGYEVLRMTDPDVQSQIDYILDSLYYDDETGKVMRSVTVAGGDVEQEEFL